MRDCFIRTADDGSYRIEVKIVNGIDLVSNRCNLSMVNIMFRSSKAITTNLMLPSYLNPVEDVSGIGSNARETDLMVPFIIDSEGYITFGNTNNHKMYATVFWIEKGLPF